MSAQTESAVYESVSCLRVKNVEDFVEEDWDVERVVGHRGARTRAPEVPGTEGK
jgi:hypothetical protein